MVFCRAKESNKKQTVNVSQSEAGDEGQIELRISQPFFNQIQQATSGVVRERVDCLDLRAKVDGDPVPQVPDCTVA